MNHDQNAWSCLRKKALTAFPYATTVVALKQFWKLQHAQVVAMEIQKRKAKS